MEAGPFGRPLQLRNIPRPHFVGPDRQELGQHAGVLAEWPICGAFGPWGDADRSAVLFCLGGPVRQPAIWHVRVGGFASHLARLKDFDGLDTQFLAPAAGFVLGQRTAPHPFSVAAGRDALGPELARRVRGEVDHDAVRVDVAHAAALVHLAGGIGGLELDSHDCSDMK